MRELTDVNGCWFARGQLGSGRSNGTVMTLTHVELDGLPLPLPEATEPSLLERLAAAEPAAVGEVYDEHHRSVRAFARRLLGDDTAAEDLVHDVFVALPRAIQNYRGASSLRTFLISVAANHARHHVRGARRRRAAADRLSREPRTEGTTPEHEARRTELADALTKAMETLSVDHRLTFVLCEVEQRSSREVARILGVPDATVRTRCHHAKKRLRALLEKEGLE